MFFHDVPDRLFRDAGSPDLPGLCDATKKFAVDYTRRRRPEVNCLLHSVRNRNGSDVSALSDHVDGGPVIFSALQVMDRQFR